MPWHIENDNPDCSGFAVVKNDDAKVVGCHKTKANALAQLAALNINVKEKEMAGDERAAVDNSAWDGNAAMVAAGASDDPAAAFKAICAGRRAGDPALRTSWALPHHRNPGDPPNADGVRNSRSRLPQTQDLTNREEADRHLARHMETIQAQQVAGARPPRDNLVRAMPAGYELREQADDGMPILTGHFAVFNQWTLIDSAFEGRFMERIAPGAFRKTLTENRARIRVLFQHGKDPHIGDKVLGMPETLEEDQIGPRYDVPLFDTTYNRDLLPGLRAGAYGSSFRFRVTREDVDRKPKESSTNPDNLPERTIREAEVFEFGPVTFPAYAGADAGIRSMTDEFVFDSLTADPARLRELVAYIEPGAPSADAGASPHLGPERRDVPVAPPPSTPQEIIQVADTYSTRDEKVARINELKADINALAVEYTGVLPEDAQARWNAMTKEQTDLTADVKAYDERVAYVRSQAEAQTPGRVTTGSFSPPNVIKKVDPYDLSILGGRSEEDRAQVLRDNAMRSVDTMWAPHPRADQAQVKGHVARLLDTTDSSDKELAKRVLITGNPVYRRAFNKAICGIPFSNEEARAAALAVTGTTGTGGYMIPYFLDPTIVGIGAVSLNPYRAACRVVQLVGVNNWRAVTSTAVAAIYETEALAATEAGPTIGQPSFTVQRASAFVSVSYETMEDRPDLVSELSVLIQEGKDVLEEAQFAVGTGATVYPFGLCRTAAYTAYTTITDNVTAIADLYAIEAAVPLRHRINGAWFFGRSAIRTIQGWETTGGILFGNQYATVGELATPNARGNTGLKLLGYPVWESPSIPTTFTTNAAIVGWLGDPKSYVIVDRIGMNVEVIPNLFDGAGKPMGQRGIFAMWRNTAKPINADAGRQITVQ